MVQVLDDRYAPRRRCANTPDLIEVDPAWSADGTRIAYVEGSVGFNRLMVMNADGSGQTVITPTPSTQFGPAWSPDGSRPAATTTSKE